VKLFVKGNEKLTFAIAIGVLSILALSITLSPTFNLLVKAQGQNESGMSQGVQQQLVELATKVKVLASKAGLNLTIPQGGNLTEKIQALSDSPEFSNVSQQISQQLSQLGINGSNIQSLKQVAGSDFGDLVQKLQNLTSSRGA
jgi:hypothetical protein